MSLHLQPVRVRMRGGNTESQLVFVDGALVAILTHLSDEYGDEAGMWFLEQGFGPVEDRLNPKFTGLDEAQSWIMRRMAGTSAHG
ncbi:hypothetical protein [Methylobacterium nigriterrae]|uniref:hypothetical protein n=1 Tax=Methylobacterium nigriterrae TaxID=3127512 RepID=UPI003013FF92